jgi:hypothetical protein
MTYRNSVHILHSQKDQLYVGYHLSVSEIKWFIAPFNKSQWYGRITVYWNILNLGTEIRNLVVSFRHLSIADNNLMKLYTKQSLYYMFCVTHVNRSQKCPFLKFHRKMILLLFTRAL